MSSQPDTYWLDNLMAHGPERMASSKDQDHGTVRQTPDSVGLPSPAERIVRPSYRRGSHRLSSLLSRETEERSSSVTLSERSAAPSQYTSSHQQSSSHKRHRSQEKMKISPSPKENRASSGKAKRVRPSSTTRSQRRVSHSEGNVFSLIREQFRKGGIGGEGPTQDSVSSASSPPKDPNSRSTSCYSRYEETIQTTREWMRTEGTVEEPRSGIAPRNKPRSRTISRSHTPCRPDTSPSPPPTRMNFALVPTIEMQPSRTELLPGDPSIASQRSDPTRVLSQDPRKSSSISRWPLNDAENPLSLVGSRRSQTALSSRERSPSALSSRTRPIHTQYAPPDRSSRPRPGLEQECLGTDPPFLDSEDSLFGSKTGLPSQADVADSRFMTPIVTERQAHNSVQSILSDAVTSQAGSSVSGIDDTYLEELAKGRRLDPQRESRARQDTAAARRRQEEEEARKHARSPGYWRQRQEEEDAEIAEMAREERRSTLSEPRAKLPWSLKETRCLVRLWEQHPNEWAKIKRLDRASDDPQLTTRSQVDLKDKMRNVKMWMLKNQIQLSEKWARITLTAAQKRAVANCQRMEW